jgi:hypothetical protein
MPRSLRIIEISKRVFSILMIAFFTFVSRLVFGMDDGKRDGLNRLYLD